MPSKIRKLGTKSFPTIVWLLICSFSQGLSQTTKDVVVVGALVLNYEGLEAGAKGNLENAKEKFAGALQYEPYFPAALLNMQIYHDVQIGVISSSQAILLYKTQNQFSGEDSVKSLALATQALQFDDRYALAYLIRASTGARLGMLESVRADFDRAVELAPASELVHYFRGKFGTGHKKYRSAIVDFSTAISLNDRWPHLYLERGLAYSEVGEHTKAAEDFEIALKFWPRWEKNFKIFGAFLNRGIANIERENFEQAVADLNRAIRMNPKFQEAYLNRGLAYVNLRLYDQAISDFDYVLTQDQSSSEAFYHRGLCWQDKGDYEAAVENFLQTIRLQPEHVQAHYHLGEIYSRQRLLEEAVLEFDKVIELDPAMFWAYYRKALAYDKLKDWPTAIKSYNAFLEHVPSEHGHHAEFARERAKKLARWTQ